jgi:hypothetical protein
MPESEQDWRRIYLLRRLSARQKQRAYELGATMAKAIQSGRLQPVTMEKMIPAAMRWLMERIFTFSPPYRVAK